MSDDAKEWKTVKIEAPVRDDAQADPRTYSEIMRAGLDETPTPNGEIPEGMLRTIVCDALDGVEVPAADMDAEVRDQLDRIEDAAREATNAAQNAERAVEELAGQR